MRIDLGGGDWADLKDPALVTNGDRKAALAYYMSHTGDAEGVAPHAWAGQCILLDGYLKTMVENWSFEMPVPSTDVGVMDRLPLEKANRLYAAVQPLMDATRPDFTPDGHKDPKAATGSSAGSKRR